MTFPSAVGSFTAMSDDTSDLAADPASWGYYSGSYNVGLWSHEDTGSMPASERLSNHAAFIGYGGHWNVGFDGTRWECDDYVSTTTAPGTAYWYIWVR